MTLFLFYCKCNIIIYSDINSIVFGSKLNYFDSVKIKCLAKINIKLNKNKINIKEVLKGAKKKEAY